MARRSVRLIEVPVALQVVGVFPLKQGCGEFAVLFVGDMQRIYAEILAAIGQGVQSFRAFEIEQRFHTQKNKPQ
jgi:hypothetical protein